VPSSEKDTAALRVRCEKTYGPISLHPQTEAHVEEEGSEELRKKSDGFVNHHARDGLRTCRWAARP
jgi:hypothetical protein